MDKKKKLSSLLEKLGLTPKEVVIEWVRDGIVDLQDVKNTLEQMRKETQFVSSEQELTAGMFLYSDGKVSETYTEGQCCAMILKVGIDSLLMLSLDKALLPFCSQGSVIDTIWLKSGLNATHFIKQMADDSGAVTDAANYCLEYENAFVQKKQAFMLTAEEVKELECDLELIIPALRKAGVTDGFWLSTVADTDNDNGKASAQIGVFMPDRVAVQKEYIKIPQSVYPAFELKISRLNFTS